MEKYFSKTAEILDRRLPYLTKSSYKRMMMDLSYFDLLMNTVDCNSFKISGHNRFKYDDATFIDYFNAFYDQLGALSNQAIDMYKENNFYYFNRVDYEKIDNKKQIVEKFFEYFMPDANNIMRDMISNNHILISDLDGYFVGCAYPLIETNESYLMLDRSVLENDLFFIETLVHEIMHIYCSTFLKNYHKYGLEEMNYGLLAEAVTMYSELSLYDFLKKEEYVSNDVEFTINTKLYTTLYNYKNVKYLSEALNNQHLTVIRGTRYDIVEDFELDGEYPFQYEPGEFSSGYLNCCEYAVGNLYAYQLYKKELEGKNPKKEINDFLISLQDADCYDLLLNEKYNFDLMKKNIDDNMSKIKKMYKFK